MISFREFYSTKYPEFEGDYERLGSPITPEFFDRLFSAFEEYLKFKEYEENYWRRMHGE